MYIAKTNIERELEALKNGVQIPMDDGSKRMVSPDEIKSGNKLVFVFIDTVFTVLYVGSCYGYLHRK